MNMFVLLIFSLSIKFTFSDENVLSRLSYIEKRLETERILRRNLEEKIDTFQEKLTSCDMANKQLQKKMASQEIELRNLKDTISIKDNHRIPSTIEASNNRTMVPSRAKRQDIPEAVAFTAYIDNNPQHIGMEQVIPYNRVVSNIGASFNINTHIFTCPVTGIYLFSYVVSQLGMTEIDLKLVVDGKNTVDAIADPVTASHDQQATNLAVLQVNKGQTVYVVNYYHSDVNIRSDELYRFSSFSGVLIQPL